MEFRALGPLAAILDGEEIDLGPYKQRSLLALLLIHANLAVSLDQIVEQLWPDEDVDRTNAVRVYTSRLRAALEPGRTRNAASILETHGDGYLLRVDTDHYDAARFEQQVETGRNQRSAEPAKTATLLGDALDLWRGSAFEDFMYDGFVQTERTRLSEIRVGALEDRIEADLACGLSGQLVSEIEVLREAHPLRERLVSQHMLALYRSGRAADALRTMSSFRRLLGEELGVDPSPALSRLEEQVLLHDDAIQQRASEPNQRAQPLGDGQNPFKGLRPFDTDDADVFFGRDALVANVLRLLDGGQRLVALVGPSGSGKSSLVRAGLIPALAKGALPGSDNWLVASMMPGAHPFAELEAALLRSTLDSPDSLDEQLRDSETGILRAVLRVLPGERSRLLLVIDQFEELFTMVEDEALRGRFLSNLVTALDDPHGRISVVLTLRADFYGQPLSHPEFGARLGDGIVNVTPLTAEELEAAALKPAGRAGVSFEAALLGQLIAGVGTQPGALPLFQYTLTELFDRRAGDVLEIATYRDMGGVDGALQRRATDLYEQLDPTQQAAAKQLFLRLVSVSEGDQRSRRRVAAREVASVGVDTVVMHDVIARFGEYRLLSFDSDHLSGAPTVEVAHEALLTAWPTLQHWIDDGRVDMRRHASLVTAMREWQIADRSPAYLLREARLNEYSIWQETSDIVLNDAEQAFLDAGAEHVEAEQAERAEHRLGETRARRRLWGLVAALMTSLGVAGAFLLGVFAADPGPTVTFFGARNADAVGDSINSGVERADDELDMVLDDVRWAVDPAAEFRELAATEPEFVITDASALFVPEIFFDHPEIRFGVIDPADGGVASLPNVTHVGFRNEEGAFLAGVAAASTTETGIVGFVGGSQIPLIEEFRAGYEAGVRAVDPEIQVLSTFVDQFGAADGFGDVMTGQALAAALYDRNADVVFHAAGLSGRGIFPAAADYSSASGRHVWGIGVDVDQWFDFSGGTRDHVLTSMIKRQDVAAYVIVEHMLAGGANGEAAALGLAEGGYDYSTSGDAMSPDVIATLDRFIADITAERISVPTEPKGPVLFLDEEGNEVEQPVDSGIFVGIDFPEMFSPVEPGTYQLAALGTPLTVSFEGDWSVQPNILGHTVFTHPESFGQGDRDVSFFRPTVFGDPTNPAAIGPQQLWPAEEMEGLDGFEEWLDLLVDGIVSQAPSRVEIAGRDAVYFEAELSDDFECGPEVFCAAFLLNDFSAEIGPSWWPFEPGIHQRIWVVDGGEYPPLVIIAATLTGDRGFQTEADRFLSKLVIGEPQPHPRSAP